MEQLRTGVPRACRRAFLGVWVVLVLGCEARPHARDSEVPASAPAPRGGGGVYSPQSTQAVATLLAWVDGDAGALARAQAFLGAAVAREPRETWLRMLLAWTWRAAGDAGREASVVAGLPEDRRPAYARLFARETGEVVAALRYRAWDACRVERGPACPPAPARPSDWAVFEQVAWFSHSEDRVERWKPGAGGTSAFLDAVGASPGMRIADVGAGEGYFTLPLARRVGMDGRVVATEVDPVFTGFIDATARDLGLGSVATVVQSPHDVGLEPGAFDLVLMCEVFKAIATNASAEDPEHVRAHVAPFLASVSRALAAGGRLVVVDHDAPESSPKAISPATVRRLAEAAGFRLVVRDDRWAPMEVIQVFEVGRR